MLKATRCLRARMRLIISVGLGGDYYSTKRTTVEKNMGYKIIREYDVSMEHHGVDQRCGGKLSIGDINQGC